MSVSLPSKRIITIDVPDVKRFSSQFVYNFFVNDEMINEDAAGTVVISSTDAADAVFIDRVSKKIPRYVLLKFDPVSTPPFNRRISIAPYLKSNKIHDEHLFCDGEYTIVTFQDTGADGKLYNLAKATLNKQINAKNDDVVKGIEAERGKISSKLDSSTLDKAKLLNDVTGKNITSNFLVESLNQIKVLGAQYIDETKQKEIVDEVFTEIKKVSIKSQINNKFIKHLAASVIEDPVGNFADEMLGVANKIQNISEKSSAGGSPNSISASEYEVDIDHISERKVDSQGFHSEAAVIGYIIEKYEILPNGKFKPKPTIIIDSATASSFLDTNVRYGAVYYYNIRTVAAFETQATSAEAEHDGVLAITFLASSERIFGQSIRATEAVPPPPPADFNVAWDYHLKATRVTWSFPPNTQRDIKKFQVFKRSSIDEPFELVRMYDFDDSIVRHPYHEQPDPQLVETNTQPKCYYIDEDFTKEMTWIYTVCSIDAHGLSSNYSTQLQVSFDKFANKLVKKLISTAGAPKSYPNALLNTDTFVDTIKDESHTKLRVIFNPEYLAVQDNKKNDLRLLATNKTGGMYKLQFVNLDLQAQQDVNIKIEDLRTTHKGQKR